MENEKSSDVIDKRREKQTELKTRNIQLFPNDFKVLHTVRDILFLIESRPESITPEAPVFVTAGRMMAINR
ncbi:MAG: lysine--tRNA ligase, partial [Desulfatirhabdiaceae bacterium]|nr:lysine--tRNA ligase [Desulfatirhabdiaceae bacterium]